MQPSDFLVSSISAQQQSGTVCVQQSRMTGSDGVISAAVSGSVTAGNLPSARSVRAFSGGGGGTPPSP